MLLLSLGLCTGVTSAQTADEDRFETLQDVLGLTESEAKVEQMQNIVKSLSRQLILQQMFVEERIRTEGDSGLKQVSVVRCFQGCIMFPKLV